MVPGFIPIYAPVPGTTSFRARVAAVCGMVTP
eukprot:CAMPEP_0175035130 /NCGR_PEP_ID=MMETSP0005-20121125/23045_1 /TAXON_ID=420556 /ORGANISM="Ochromonas sp., Strain CCMP1393" /LENGTH=31 /DNA_ID= /DNA_START= /DNA_END= /DNA_ORIENTATION=